MGYINDGGILKKAVGEEAAEAGPSSVSYYVLSKDPDNIFAMLDIAYMTQFAEDQSKTVDAYKNALELAPTDSWILPNYSYALFCNAEFSKSEEILNRAGKWHQDHRYILSTQIKVSNALGDYGTALTSLRKLHDQGIVAQEENGALFTLLDDLGRPELALPHIRFAPFKAFMYAKMGNKDAALEEASVIANFSRSLRSKMIVEEGFYPENYNVNYGHKNVGKPDDATKANLCRLDYLALDTFVLRETNSDKYEAFENLLLEYFANKDPRSFDVRQEYTGLMALHVLQGKHDKAIKVMDIAMERGFHFIGSFKEPYLRDLTSHPGFPERLEKMQRSADRLIEEHYTQ